jgi:arsenate reductase
MTVTVYHNPRCGKSRATLALIEGRGLIPTVVEYLKNPPNAEQLTALLQLMSLKPRQLMRRGEPVYKELALDDPSLSDAALISAMVQHPILIERPIVVANGKAVLGRPPENVLAIL